MQRKAPLAYDGRARQRADTRAACAQRMRVMPSESAIRSNARVPPTAACILESPSQVAFRRRLRPATALASATSVLQPPSRHRRLVSRSVIFMLQPEMQVSTAGQAQLSGAVAMPFALVSIDSGQRSVATALRHLAEMRICSPITSVAHIYCHNILVRQTHAAAVMTVPMTHARHK
jgi:hypothetical protein